jgi:adenylosuccinate lyase
MRFRLLVEVEYLIALAVIAKIIRPITRREIYFLHRLYRCFSETDFAAIKVHEDKTNHDVNAVVRYFKEVLKNSSLSDLVEFIHLGLTSEDINNLSFAFMLRGGTDLITYRYEMIVAILHDTIIIPHQKTSLLARTHGQPASPTTVGWEINVFSARLKKEIDCLKAFSLSVKFGGATGGHNALNVAYPDIDWRKFSADFIKRLNRLYKSKKTPLRFRYNQYTTQIEPHDTYAALFDIIKRANTILIDFSRDMWFYIALEIFTQKPVPGEDGSSAMPNKVNPIDFENAEGNCGIANALFNFFSAELPISRLQRHLADSTIIRNFGTAYAHTLISLKSLEKGLSKVYVNTNHTQSDLENHWGVVAEAYQTILRRVGILDGYDLLKGATRGKEVTKEELYVFIDQLAKEKDLSSEVVKELKNVTPHNYVGDRKL